MSFILSALLEACGSSQKDERSDAPEESSVPSTVFLSHPPHPVLCSSGCRELCGSCRPVCLRLRCIQQSAGYHISFRSFRGGCPQNILQQSARRNVPVELSPDTPRQWRCEAIAGCCSIQIPLQRQCGGICLSLHFFSICSGNAGAIAGHCLSFDDFRW